MKKALLALPLIALALSGCGQNSSDRAASGAMIGAGAGALFGGLAGGSAGSALVGAAVGGASGAVIGAATTPQGERLVCWVNRYGEEICRVRR
jgi:osmotically inducible lipoprotein OsmB